MDRRLAWRLLLLCALLFPATSPSASPALAQTCPPAIQYGETLECTIDSAGEVDTLTFSGLAGDSVRVRAIGTSGTLVAEPAVLGPDGSALCTNKALSELTCKLTASGEHAVRVQARSRTGTGRYAVHLQRLSAPVGCVAAVPGTSLTSGHLATQGEMDCFTFNASAGDRIRVQVSVTSGALVPFPEVVGPSGATICEPPLSSAYGTPNAELTCRLLTGGNHLLLISDTYAPPYSPGNATGTYAVSLLRLNNPVGCATAQLGVSPNAGSIGVVGEVDCWTLTAVAGDHIRGQALGVDPSFYPTIEILGPNGDSFCGGGTTYPPIPLDKGIGSSGPGFAPYPYSAPGLNCLIESGGTHTVLVDAAPYSYYPYGPSSGYAGTGPYRLYLQRLNNPIGCDPISIGVAAQPGALDPVGETDCYALPAQAGQQLRVTVLTTSGGSWTPGLEVLRPDGTNLCTGSISYGTVYPPTPLPGLPPTPLIRAEAVCTVDTAGQQAVLVSSYTPGGSYVIGVECLSGGCPELGGKDLRLRGDTSQLTWTGGQGQAGYVVWRITLPSGQSGFLPPGGLPASATSWTDSGPKSDPAYCYSIVPVGPFTPLGVSDVLCSLPNSAAGAARPQGLTLQLNQSSTATLNWSAPVGGVYDGYQLRVIPLGGGPWQTSNLAAVATTTTHNTGGQPTCYELLTMSGGVPVGRADLLCGIPGVGTLGQSRSRTEASAKVAQLLRDGLRVSFGARPSDLTVRVSRNR